MALNFSFLEKEDLTAVLFEQYIEDDEPEDITALEIIERQQIAAFKTKLRQRYKVDEAFSAQGTARDPEIVKHLAAMVCYYMIKRNAPRKIPEDFKNEMKMATQWLKDVRDGIEVPDIEKVENRGELKYGSSRNEDWLV